jgi:hypothetical protein
LLENISQQSQEIVESQRMIQCKNSNFERFHFLCNGSRYLFAAIMISTYIPITLHGLWTQPSSVFMWQSAKIFRKNSSENENDYWISFATGACLASSSRYTSARYDPMTNYLIFNQRGNV